MKLNNLICLKCNKEFHKPPSKIKKGGEFCSKYCKDLYYRGSNHHGWKGGEINKECLICKNIFTTAPSQNRKFCSIECRNVAHSLGMSSSNNHRWVNKIARVCGECGKKFYVYPCVKNKGAGIFCSRKCRGAWQSKNKIKENSSRWKGGISPTNVIIRTSKEYTNWRLQVFKRDNYKCQKCGQVRGEIQAHHKKRFSFILNDIKQKFPLLSISDMAFTTKELWDISNGITLCKKCHKLEHRRK